jgi:hypothetical protein
MEASRLSPFEHLDWSGNIMICHAFHIKQDLMRPIHGLLRQLLTFVTKGYTKDTGGLRLGMQVMESRRE